VNNDAADADPAHGAADAFRFRKKQYDDQQYKRDAHK
jgi:hypothetical protein